MKQNYESPIVEIFAFDVKDNVMDSECTTLQCSADNIPCIVDGVCATDFCQTNAISGF